MKKQEMIQKAESLGIKETIENLISLDQKQVAENMIKQQEKLQSLEQENQRLKQSSQSLTTMQKVYNSFLQGEQQKVFTLVEDCLNNFNLTNKDLLNRNDSSMSNIPTAIRKSLVYMYHNNILNKDSELFQALNQELYQVTHTNTDSTNTDQTEQAQANTG